MRSLPVGSGQNYSPRRLRVSALVFEHTRKEDFDPLAAFILYVLTIVRTYVDPATHRQEGNSEVTGEIYIPGKICAGQFVVSRLHVLGKQNKIIAVVIAHRAIVGRHRAASMYKYFLPTFNSRGFHNSLKNGYMWPKHYASTGVHALLATAGVTQ